MVEKQLLATAHAPMRLLGDTEFRVVLRSQVRFIVDLYKIVKQRRFIIDNLFEIDISQLTILYLLLNVHHLYIFI